MKLGPDVPSDTGEREEEEQCNFRSETDRERKTQTNSFY